MPVQIDFLNSYSLTVDYFQCNLRFNSDCSIRDSSLVNLTVLTSSQALSAYNVDGFTVEKVRCNNSAYHLQLNIFAPGGQRLGYLLTDHTKKYGPMQHLHPFHAENEAFYTLDFGAVFSAFLSAFTLEMTNVTRLDIALDTQQCDPAQLINCHIIQPDLYQRVGYKNNTDLLLINDSTCYGSKSTKVKLSLYNKTQELQTKPKPYVIDWYIANGFRSTLGHIAYDPNNPVYRVEVSLRAGAFKKHDRFALTEDGKEVSLYMAEKTSASIVTRSTKITTTYVSLERLNSPAYLASLFEWAFPIHIRKKNTSRSTNATDVPLIDFDIYGLDPPNTSVVTRPMRNSLTTEKNLLKRLVIEYLDTKEDLYLTAAQHLAERRDLTGTLAQLVTKFVTAPTLSYPFPQPQSLAAYPPCITM